MMDSARGSERKEVEHIKLDDSGKTPKLFSVERLFWTSVKS